MRKVFGIIALSLGLVLVIAAPLVRWVVAPRMTVLPSDMETLRIYTGVATQIVNPSSLSGTTVGPGVLRNVPVTLRHYTKVLKTDGNNALIADQRVVAIPGYTVADLHYRFGIDRKTFQQGGDFPGVTHQTGLTINWPIGTNKHDYTGWVPDTMTTTPAHYTGEATRGGVATYVFTSTVPTTPIKDPELLKNLPSSMTKAQLLELVPSLGLSQDQLLKMNKLVAGLPDPVPLAYSYTQQATFWVAPASGVVVDMKQREVRSVNFVDGAKLIPVSPVMDMTYTSTPATLAAAAKDAKDNAAQIKLITDTAPAGLLIIGLVLTTGGILLLTVFRRRPAAAPPAPAEPQRGEMAGVG